MGRSLLVMGALMGADVRLGGPPDLRRPDEVVQIAKDIATRTGATITLTTDPTEAVAGPDFVQPMSGSRWARPRTSGWSAATARRRRDGIEGIPAEQVVAAEVVLIAAGDQVPADGRILHASALQIDESVLTGESVPAGKDASTLADTDLGPGDRSNMAFMNTPVTHGRGVLIVSGTAKDSELGKISGMLSATAVEQSPLTRELNRAPAPSMPDHPGTTTATASQLAPVRAAVVVTKLMAWVDTVMADGRQACGVRVILIVPSYQQRHHVPGTGTPRPQDSTREAGMPSLSLVGSAVSVRSRLQGARCRSRRTGRRQFQGTGQLTRGRLSDGSCGVESRSSPLAPPPTPPRRSRR